MTAASLEENISIADQNSLGRTAYVFAIQACSALESGCHWPGKTNIAGILGFGIAQVAYLLLYKGLLFDRLLADSPDGILCVGSPQAPPINGLALGFGRFDSIFTMLAGDLAQENIEVLDYTDDPKRLSEMDAWVKSRPLGVWEKLLSGCTNTPSSFFYKLWRTFEKAGRFKILQLWPKPRKRLYVYKDCELIEESFFALLLLGASFSRLPLLPEEDVNSQDMLSQPILDSLRTSLNAAYAATKYAEHIDLGPGSKAARIILVERVLAVASKMYEALPQLRTGFGSILRNMGTNAVVVTNFFASPKERLFGMYCREHGVPVVAFEHGITLGLSDWAKFPARFWGMLVADIGVYHWERSLEDIWPWLGGQRVILGGIPRVTTSIPLRSVQRALARKWLGIPHGAKVVIYAADVERNNAIYGPHMDNDLQYIRCTEAIVKELVFRNPEAVVLLKLYPTHRYVESYSFESLLRRHPEVRVIRDMDFRFVRAAADLIALSSSQSTLGWAIGAGCPVWMFEKEASPVRLSGKDLNINVPGISRVIELEIMREVVKGDCMAVILEPIN